MLDLIMKFQVWGVAGVGVGVVEPPLIPASLYVCHFFIPSEPLAKVPGPKSHRARQAVQMKYWIGSLNQNISSHTSEYESSGSEPLLGLQTVPSSPCPPMVWPLRT